MELGGTYGCDPGPSAFEENREYSNVRAGIGPPLKVPKVGSGVWQAATLTHSSTAPAQTAHNWHTALVLSVRDVRSEYKRGFGDV